MIRTRFATVAVIAIGGLLELSATPVLAGESKVTGAITVNGKPLASGRIIFHQTNGQFVGSKIKDGKYTIDRVPTGVLTVTVEGKNVPAAFTRDGTSALRANVKEGRCTFDFNLKTSE